MLNTEDYHAITMRMNIQNIIQFGFAAAARLHRTAAWLMRMLARGSELLVSRLGWSARLSVLCALMGATAGWVGVYGLSSYLLWADFLPEQLAFFNKSGFREALGHLSNVFLFSAWILLAAGLLAFWRRRFSYHILKVGAALYIVVWAWALRLMCMVPSAMFLSTDKVLPKDVRDYLWIRSVSAWLPFLLLGLLFLLCLCLNEVTRHYGGKPHEGLLVGDRILRNLRTHGSEPRFRIASYWSTFAHLFVIVMLPFLLRGGCMQKPYGIPKGMGQPVVQMVKVKRVKPKPKEQFVFNPNSAISYYVPDIDDSKIREEVEEETLDTYEASTLVSGLGAGGPGKGGWPNGMENAKVRFVRLRYAGGDWDQQMGKGADYNFLLQFRELTGFKIADRTEAIHVADLRRFPKHRAPPFVYLTGSGSISVSSRDAQTLRWYLQEEGGMIFADNGGGNFNAAFRSLMRRVMPDNSWIDIANDDVLYRQPYLFPNGAPPLWHHSGVRALGMKHQGRWVVFYHQGDLNDAWQTGGSGASASLQSQSFKLGVNVVNYSFNQYMSIHFGQ